MVFSPRKQSFLTFKWSCKESCVNTVLDVSQKHQELASKCFLWGKPLMAFLSSSGLCEYPPRGLSVLQEAETAANSYRDVVFLPTCKFTRENKARVLYVSRTSVQSIFEC